MTFQMIYFLVLCTNKCVFQTLSHFVTKSQSRHLNNFISSKQLCISKCRFNFSWYFVLNGHLSHSYACIALLCFSQWLVKLHGYCDSKEHCLHLYFPYSFLLSRDLCTNRLFLKVAFHFVTILKSLFSMTFRSSELLDILELFIALCNSKSVLR